VVGLNLCVRWQGQFVLFCFVRQSYIDIAILVVTRSYYSTWEVHRPKVNTWPIAVVLTKPFEKYEIHPNHILKCTEKSASLVQTSTGWILTLVDQLDAQKFCLFTHNTFIKNIYMFRALPCSSSGGLRRNCIYVAAGIVTVCRWLSCAPVNRCTCCVRAVFVVGPAGQPARPRTQHDCHHDTKAKPEAATAVIELLMMSGKPPETCWAVNKRQDNKLKNCCIRLVSYLNCTIMHGLTNLTFYT
jgi:hypothetical protein